MSWIIRFVRDHISEALCLGRGKLRTSDDHFEDKKIVKSLLSLLSLLQLLMLKAKTFISAYDAYSLCLLNSGMSLQKRRLTAMTTSVRQQSWWVVAVPGGLPFSVYLHISCFSASLSTLPPLEHTHALLWSIFQTTKHRWNRCNDPTVNLAYNVAPQRQATPSCVDLRGLLLRQGCQLKIFIK